MSYQDFLNKGELIGKSSYIGHLEEKFSDGHLKVFHVERLFQELGIEVLNYIDKDYPFIIRLRNTGWQKDKTFEGKQMKLEAELYPMNDGELNKLKMSLSDFDPKPPDEFDFNGSMNTGSTVRFLNMVFEQNITQLPADEDIKFNKTIECSDGVVRTNFHRGTLFYQIEKDYTKKMV